VWKIAVRQSVRGVKYTDVRVRVRAKVRVRVI
jgi:hypothetical protein